MNPAHLAHTTGKLPTAGDRRFYERQPSQDSPVMSPTDQPYFPEGGVAAPPFMIVNPLSNGTGGPTEMMGNGVQNELVGPVTAEWIEVRDSHEQGVGVPRFKAFARNFHVVPMNFGSLDVMPFPDQLGPVPVNTQRPAKIGWSVPKFGEQYHRQTAVFSIADLMQTRDPASVAFAIGWGYVG